MSKNILLLPHPFRPNAVQFAARMAAFLAETDCRVCALPEVQPLLLAAGAKAECFQGQADFAAVIGGDGTVLRSVHALPNADFPFWAVNFGHVGYLTDCEPAESFDALRAVLNGSCTVERRTLLQVELNLADHHATFTALNEAVVHRSALSRALKIHLSVSGRYLQTFPADGILIATPTGSTAYNLSAGGPILMPESANLAVTPICSHLLGGGSIVVSGEDTVGVQISLPASEEDHSAEPPALPTLVIDGFEHLSLQDGAQITLRRAEKQLLLLRTKTDSFYQTLQRKLSLPT